MHIYYFNYLYLSQFGHHQVYLIFIFCTVTFQSSFQMAKAGVVLVISRNVLNQYAQRDVFLWGFNVPPKMQTFFGVSSNCPIFSPY
jgi:hypothetical protein